jgi:NTE family protein
MKENFMGAIRNLVFEGGGVKGLAYLGFLSVFNSEIEKVKRYGGASAGSLLALMLALNYSFPEIEKEYKRLDFNKFKDDDFGVIRDMTHLIENFGFYKGEELLKFVQHVIKNKTGREDITFKEMKEDKAHYKDLYVISTKLFYIGKTAASETVTFSNKNTPQTPVALAVVASMAIPGYFPPIRFKKLSDGSYIRDDREGDVFVDGGVTNNYPVRIFDKIKYSFSEIDSEKNPEEYQYNESTLGIRLDTKPQIDKLRDHKEEKETRKIENFHEFVVATLSAVMSAQDESLIDSADAARTIFIDCTGVSATDFDLGAKEKQQLIDAGSLAAKEYFAKKAELPPPQRLKNSSQFKFFSSSKSALVDDKESSKEKPKKQSFCRIL